MVSCLLWSVACFSPDSTAPTDDASVPADATTPDDAPGPTSTPPDAANPPDATATTPPASDGGTGDATAPDAPVDSPVSASCSDWDAAFELDASAGDGAASVNADGGGALPGPPPAVCSTDGDTHAPLAAVNNAPCAIDMWWVDYNCQEEYFGTVDPNGGTWSSDTWETHPWRIRLTGSEVLLEEIPAVPEGADASLRTIVYP
jgi:hypothetical protein